MAGIEKVCEYSGEHPGSDMYRYKRCSIQIMPKYRKLFRGCDFIFYMTKTKTLFGSKYEYLLHVFNASLHGRVDGFYYGWSCDRSTVIRKIKRLTRDYTLEIIKVDELPERDN